MICRSSDIYYRLAGKSVRKLKNYVINYARYIMLKNHFLWFALEHVTVIRTSKENSDLQLAY